MDKYYRASVLCRLDPLIECLVWCLVSTVVSMLIINGGSCPRLGRVFEDVRLTVYFFWWKWCCLVRLLIRAVKNCCSWFVFYYHGVKLRLKGSIGLGIILNWKRSLYVSTRGWNVLMLKVRRGSRRPLKSHDKMAGSWVFLNLLGNLTSYISGFPFEIEISFLHWLKVVRFLIPVSLLYIEMMLSKLFWLISIILTRHLLLLNELFFGFRYIVDSRFTSKLNVWILKINCTRMLGLRITNLRGRRSLRYRLMIDGRGILQVSVLLITNFKANCLHLMT